MYLDAMEQIFHSVSCVNSLKLAGNSTTLWPNGSLLWMCPDCLRAYIQNSQWWALPDAHLTWSVYEESPPFGCFEPSSNLIDSPHCWQWKSPTSAGQMLNLEDSFFASSSKLPFFNLWPLSYYEILSWSIIVPAALEYIHQLIADKCSI